MASETELFYLVLLTLLTLIVHLILSTKNRRHARHSHRQSIVRDGFHSIWARCDNPYRLAGSIFWGYRFGVKWIRSHV